LFGFLLGAVTSINHEDEYFEVHQKITSSDKVVKLKKPSVVIETSNFPKSSSQQSLPEEINLRQALRRRMNVRGRPIQKRSLIIPGTNWCGVGNISSDTSVVGELAGPDRCCRNHDHCPYTIGGMTTKYNMYNFRMTTLSHCECDDIFRTCLKMVSTREADIVGELFFNYLEMKCFVFKRETVCAERTWWGKCKRETTRSVADLRDPLTY